ncbi:DUF4294 domain-containing protein [Paracrocinitomix mangrovi]|uniref:DUF4294 domain-containing protein n=1 Tax=Paracrocinitomix mangrovi TaxID=2862509 RepID=UPI001C8E918C|nr:DUF4294 domain-containing protein [Paracrocinitomix mangrovi]UKN02594.1 DUF4294 domain-containing protein [Paracrocinitomix mangrovi]
MKTIVAILGMFICSVSFGQISGVDDQLDSLLSYETDPVPVYTKDYLRQYNRYKRIIKKVYPYALYASDVLYELESDAENIAKERKKKKFYKEAYKDLKQDFKFVFLDFYTSEGKMLMKLIHRETGMTVYDIAKKYKGQNSATMFNVMGKLWDQDVKAKYDPEGEDKIAEHVIQDIESGKITFNSKVVRVTKDEYKEDQKKQRQRQREYKKRKKQNDKDCD